MHWYLIRSVMITYSLSKGYHWGEIQKEEEKKKKGKKRKQSSRVVWE